MPRLTTDDINADRTIKNLDIEAVATKEGTTLLVIHDVEHKDYKELHIEHDTPEDVAEILQHAAEALKEEHKEVFGTK